MIKAVLFDIDGTLVDSNNLHVECWQRVFGDAGRAVDEGALRSQMGKGGDNLLPALLPDLSSCEQEDLTEAHGTLFRDEFIDRVTPFAGATALLDRCHRAGHQVILATSAGKRELDHYVDLLGIADVVAATTSKDDVGASKPAPDIFAAALKKAGVAGDEAIAIGDTPYDVEAAGKAGVGTIAVLTGGFAERTLTEAGADIVYADVATLLAQYDASPLSR